MKVQGRILFLEWPEHQDIRDAIIEIYTGLARSQLMGFSRDHEIVMVDKDHFESLHATIPSDERFHHKRLGDVGVEHLVWHFEREL